MRNQYQKQFQIWLLKNYYYLGGKGKNLNCKEKLILLFKRGIIISLVKLSYFTFKWPNLDFGIQVPFHFSHALSSEWIKLAFCHFLSVWQKKKRKRYRKSRFQNQELTHTYTYAFTFTVFIGLCQNKLGYALFCLYATDFYGILALATSSYQQPASSKAMVKWIKYWNI